LDRLHLNSYLHDFPLSSMGVIEASDDKQVNDYATWESHAKLVLPQKHVIGKVGVGECGCWSVIHEQQCNGRL
jgi:hypothetical protein